MMAMKEWKKESEWRSSHEIFFLTTVYSLAGKREEKERRIFEKKKKRCIIITNDASIDAMMSRVLRRGIWISFCEKQVLLIIVRWVSIENRIAILFEYHTCRCHLFHAIVQTKKYCGCRREEERESTRNASGDGYDVVRFSGAEEIDSCIFLLPTLILSWEWWSSWNLINAPEKDLCCFISLLILCNFLVWNNLTVSCYCSIIVPRKDLKKNTVCNGVEGDADDDYDDDEKENMKDREQSQCLNNNKDRTWKEGRVSNFHRSTFPSRGYFMVKMEGMAVKGKGKKDEELLHSFVSIITRTSFFLYFLSSS